MRKYRDKIYSVDSPRRTELVGVRPQLPPLITDLQARDQPNNNRTDVHNLLLLLLQVNVCWWCCDPNRHWDDGFLTQSSPKP